MASVYHKLLLDKKDEQTGRTLHKSVREKILDQKVCPLLKKLVGKPSNLKNFPLGEAVVLEEFPAEWLAIIEEGKKEPEVIEGKVLEPGETPEPAPPPPPPPPEEFYPPVLYNAWLLVVEDDEPDGGDPLPPPPPQPPRVPAWLVALAFLACLAVGVGAYFWGGGFLPFATNTPVPTPTIQFTSTPEPSLTPPVQQTDTQTALPSETLTPTLTLTPTPTNTAPPVNLTKGAVLQDNSVTLKFKDFKYEQGRTRTGQRPVAPILFEFDFTNNSGETILLQLDQDKFRAEDNLGNRLTCEFWNNVTEAVETIQQPLESGKTWNLGVFCGEGKIPPGVTTYTLYVTGFSSLPDSTWVVNVRR
jgi:hypothetical protein